MKKRMKEKMRDQKKQSSKNEPFFLPKKQRQNRACQPVSLQNLTCLFFHAFLFVCQAKGVKIEK